MRKSFKINNKKKKNTQHIELNLLVISKKGDTNILDNMIYSTIFCIECEYE
jgi:hypothetical protein